MRPWAWAWQNRNGTQESVSHRKPSHRKPRSIGSVYSYRLLVAQCLHRIETRGSGRRGEFRQQTDNDGKSDRAENKPQRHGPDLCRRKILAFEINVRSEINEAPDRPTERDSNCTADETHSACFGEEEAAHVSITGTQGLHDSDFTSAFEDGHHQRIHDADGSHGQG